MRNFSKFKLFDVKNLLKNKSFDFYQVYIVYSIPEGEESGVVLSEPKFGSTINLGLLRVR